MKNLVCIAAAFTLLFLAVAPSASSYGGGGMPPSVMLERQNVRIYAPSRVKKTVVKKARKATPVKKMQRKGERPSGGIAENAVQVMNIAIERFTFQPQRIKVKVGTTVTWTNKDSVVHTVTGDAGGPDSPRLGKDDGYSYTFDKAGTFPYYCVPHPYMTGSVEVVP